MRTTTDFLARALAAWYRGSGTGHPRAFPDQARCAQVTLGDGRGYVLLATSATVLGVFRIRPSGLLRLLKRWPKAVEVAAGWQTDVHEEATHG